MALIEEFKIISSYPILVLFLHLQHNSIPITVAFATKSALHVLHFIFYYSL